jgi:histidine triad (HIT) family protein
MDDCIFCKIVKGDIPCAKVYEDDRFLGLLDIMPVNKGHVLVIPKEHHENMWVMPKDLLGEMFGVVRDVGKAVKNATDCYYVNVNVMGIDVPHAHIHLIPRHKDDGLELWPQGKYAEGEMEEWRKKIADALGGNAE